MFDPETGSQFDSFHPVLSIGGWMLTIFSVLHFYPPLPWLKPKNHNAEQDVAADRQPLPNFNPNRPAVTRRQD
jgi:hypothetical protein